jgi:hypothetical protein
LCALFGFLCPHFLCLSVRVLTVASFPLFGLLTGGRITKSITALLITLVIQI